jgi:CO/xanthine dehydrogenase FAD-binding subunit
MPLWREYHTPSTVEAALTALSQAPGAARPIAGGTDLLLDLTQGRIPPVHTLVDLSRIEEMRRIEVDLEHVTVGAAVPHTRIVSNRMLREKAACVVEACAAIGGPQVRNVATLGGNVAHALPAGDGSIALLALDAQAEIAGASGRRWVPLEDLFAGPGEVSFDRKAEILVRFRFVPCGGTESSAFRRIMRPQGVAIAVLNMAVWIRWASDGAIDGIRLAVGAAGPRPLRARRTEAAIRGNPWDEHTPAKAVGALLAEARLRTSPHRATADYRRQLLGVLLGRLIDAARSNLGREACGTMEA